MPSETKHHIARAFSQAAQSYDSAASLQREVGNHLLDLVTQQHPLSGAHVLDIGAGSGHFSHKMQQAGAQVIALDIAAGMLQHIATQHPTLPCLLGDAEALPLTSHSQDLCFSNLSVQWCNSLTQAVAEMQRVAVADGLIAIATLCDGSLWQIKHAWQAADNQPHINPFLSEAEIRATFTSLPQAQITVHTHTQYFPTLKALLASLKNIGANRVTQRKQQGLMGKQAWQHFQMAYQSLNTPQGLPLSYQVAYIIAPNSC